MYGYIQKMYTFFTISSLFDFPERQWIELSDKLFDGKKSDSSEKIRECPTFSLHCSGPRPSSDLTPSSAIAHPNLPWENLNL